MTRPEQRDATESGVLVYPRMPIPKPRDRESEPRPPRRSRVNKILVGVIGGAVLGGVAIGMMLRPIVAPDARIAAFQKQAEEAGSAAAAQKTRADGLEKELEGVTTKKKEIEKRLEVASKAESKLADTAAEADKKAKALEAAQKKLAGAMKGMAAVAVDGDGLRVTIDTGLLFVRDDQLSDRGKQIVERVGAALKEMSDQDASGCRATPTTRRCGAEAAGRRAAAEEGRQAGPGAARAAAGAVRDQLGAVGGARARGRALPPGRGEDRSVAARRARVRPVPPGLEPNKAREPPDRDRAVSAPRGDRAQEVARGALTRAARRSSTRSASVAAVEHVRRRVQRRAVGSRANTRIGISASSFSARSSRTTSRTPSRAQSSRIARGRSARARRDSWASARVIDTTV